MSRRLSEAEIQAAADSFMGRMAEDLGGNLVRLFFGHYLDAHHEGIIRGLRFRIAELEQERRIAVCALRELEWIVPERGGALNTVHQAMDELGVSYDEE